MNTGDAEHGFNLAERIRVTIANHPFTWRQQTLFLTVSIGLGSGKAGSWQLTEVFNRLMAEADDYLYRSKKQGEIVPVPVCQANRSPPRPKVKPDGCKRNHASQNAALMLTIS